MPMENYMCAISRKKHNTVFSVHLICPWYIGTVLKRTVLFLVVSALKMHFLSCLPPLLLCGISPVTQLRSFHMRPILRLSPNNGSLLNGTRSSQGIPGHNVSFRIFCLPLI
ncbi:hypothetical protein XELAEV_18038635mg [Xenopus laevis]|uniref:Uncharacterized protein n=1 Tax=Xenopus laevis TaxID=8355 RepID=A0A974H7H6_XENLA|nr:hypothetical protein XELAEV_18038635mg [Xenopus laevis]